MNLEKARLRTFQQFPNEYVNIQTLAKYGFYYLGENETCKCYFCGIEIEDWKVYMNPLIHHWKQSSFCPILINSYTNNVPYKFN